MVQKYTINMFETSQLKMKTNAKPTKNIDLGIPPPNSKSPVTSDILDGPFRRKQREHAQRKHFRWDNVFTGYLLSIFVTELQFAISHDSTYTRMILMMGFIHFGFETSQSWYFTCSGKNATFLSTATIVMCIIQAVLVWIIPDIMAVIFGLEFAVSDCFSFVSSVCLQFNKAMPKRLRYFAFCVSLHFIGVSHALYYAPTLYFIKNGYDGTGWVMIALSSIAQIIMCRDVIRGGLNDVGPLVYDIQQNSKCFILFSKYGAPLISLTVPPGYVYILQTFRTVQGEKGAEVGQQFADWIWDDIISAVAWPFAIVGILWIIHLRATSVVPAKMR